MGQSLPLKQRHLLQSQLLTLEQLPCAAIDTLGCASYVVVFLSDAGVYRAEGTPDPKDDPLDVPNQICFKFFDGNDESYLELLRVQNFCFQLFYPCLFDGALGD